jgi:hypothetical protein
MAGGIVIATRQLLMQYFGGKASLTQPSAWWVSLHTANPGDATAGASEVSTSGTAYARQQVLNIGNAGAGRWVDATSASPTVLTNNAIIAYTAATGAGFGTVTHFGVWDASTAGNMIAYGALTGSVAVGVGVTASFAASALTLTMDHT